MSANSHHKHEVAAQDKTLIAAVMSDASLAPGSRGWQHLECAILHAQTPSGGQMQVNVPKGSKGGDSIMVQVLKM